MQKAEGKTKTEGYLQHSALPLFQTRSPKYKGGKNLAEGRMPNHKALYLSFILPSDF
jgi:hypothetical protein